MNKTSIATIIAIIVVFGSFFLTRNFGNKSLSLNIATERQSQETETSTLTPNETTSQTSPENIITYSDQGYLPKVLHVNIGSVVTFKNESSKTNWTASGVHPTHTVYPTTGGCIGSTFDACEGVQPGDSWSFKFDVAGNWDYHDHLHPLDFGTIVVEK